VLLYGRGSPPPLLLLLPPSLLLLPLPPPLPLLLLADLAVLCGLPYGCSAPLSLAERSSQLPFACFPALLP
jgi:hypothetical protein